MCIRLTWCFVGTSIVCFLVDYLVNYEQVQSLLLLLLEHELNRITTWCSATDFVNESVQHLVCLRIVLLLECWEVESDLSNCMGDQSTCRYESKSAVYPV
jgi:hypothetical protein